MKLHFKILLISLSIAFTFLLFYFLFKEYAFRDPEPSENRKIIVANKSNHLIYWLLSDYGKFDSNINDYIFDSIKTNRADSIYCNGWSWESVVNNSIDKKICIFIIAKDDVLKYGLDSVLKKQTYVKKILVDIDYLDKNNWTVIYK